MSSIAAQTLGVFSCSSAAGEGDKLAMEGKVVQRAECCPINNALYRYQIIIYLNMRLTLMFTTTSSSVTSRRTRWPRLGSRRGC